MTRKLVVRVDDKRGRVRTDSDANPVDDVNPVNISAHQTDMDSHDNVPRSDELRGVRDIKLKSDF